MKNQKHIVVVALLFLAFVFGIFLVSKRGNRLSQDNYTPTPSQVVNTDTQTGSDSNISSESKPPVQVSFLESEIELTQNQEHTSTLSFSNLPDPAPTAFTLQLTYDPQEIIVIDIEPGNLWTGENILQKEIDNELGEVMFSAGQGFTDEVTGNSQIVKVTVRSTSSNAQLVVGPESVYTSVQEKVLIPMQGLPLSVSVR